MLVNLERRGMTWRRAKSMYLFSEDSISSFVFSVADV